MRFKRLSADDSRLIAYAAQEGRILVSHHFKTAPPTFGEMIRAGLPVCAIIMVHDWAPIGRVLEELEYILEASEPSEYAGQILYLDC